MYGYMIRFGQPKKLTMNVGYKIMLTRKNPNFFLKMGWQKVKDRMRFFIYGPSKIESKIANKIGPV